MNLNRHQKHWFVFVTFIPLSPFSTAEDVGMYMNSDEGGDTVKNQRVYIEVRYARKICMSLKPKLYSD